MRQEFLSACFQAGLDRHFSSVEMQEVKTIFRNIDNPKATRAVVRSCPFKSVKKLWLDFKKGIKANGS